eukprot:TRINITY_DN39001_c0_g1_i1.p1 TRINITY_DN39001_c0_g1~~TRINITY_DN39001_c0_g1_i1.p1  ORF type:complete len:413 (+),score=45.40 TRINITY_DN39001_c0_g1_i1:40-1239(+)
MASCSVRCSVLLVVLVGCAASITFSTPSVVGAAYYATGFQGFGDGLHALGKSEDGWHGSSDGGKTWVKLWQGRSVVGSTGAVVLSKDGLTMHDFGSVETVADKDANYTCFNSSDATYFFLDSRGTFQAEVRSTPVTFRGLPTPASCGDKKHRFGCPFRLGGRGYVRLPDGILVMSVIIWWGGEHANPNPKLRDATSVVAFRSDDGLTWEYSGTIADAAQTPASEEGPNENDLALLADGKTILCVVRLDAGDGRVSRPYRPYAKATSTDGGRTWSQVTMLPKGVGSARPRLLRLPNGQLVLAGGRQGPKSRDIVLWTNEAGDGEEWIPHSISYWHNVLEPDASLHFTPAINASSQRQSTSYTSLVLTGSSSGFVVYPRSLNGTNTAFAMPFEISHSSVFV